MNKSQRIRKTPLSPKKDVVCCCVAIFAFFLPFFFVFVFLFCLLPLTLLHDKLADDIVVDGEVLRAGIRYRRIVLDFLHLLRHHDGVALANLFGAQLLVVEVAFVLITVSMY